MALPEVQRGDTVMVDLADTELVKGKVYLLDSDGPERLWRCMDEQGQPPGEIMGRATQLLKTV